MRPLTVVTIVTLLAACAEPEAPPPTSPRSAPRPTPGQAAADEASAKALKALEDRERAKVAALQEQTQNLQAQAQASIAAAEQRKRDEKAAREKACADTREARLSKVKEVVIASLDAEARLAKIRKSVLASCKLIERPTGAINVQHTGSGARAYAEKRDDVVCPGSIDKADAWVILARKREGANGPTGSIVDERDAQDMPCAELDRAAGVDLFPTWEGLDAWMASVKRP